MNNSIEPQQPASIGLDDALYIFFRHKWKIVFFSLVGIASAVGFYLYQQRESQAQAKLLVRYIVEKRNPLTEAPTDKEKEPQFRPLDPRDTATMVAESEILKSQDSLIKAFRSPGLSAGRVLAAYEGGTNELKAAELVAKKLEVEIGKGSGVMMVTLTHRDPDVARKLLASIINQYKIRHLEIHHSGATVDDLQIQTEKLRNKLRDTEADLQNQKRMAEVTSVEQSKGLLAQQIATLQHDIFLTEADIAQQEAALRERQGLTAKTDQTNAPSALDLAKARKIAARLQSLEETESDLLATFSTNSSRVVQVREQIKRTQEQLAELKIDPAYLMQLAASSRSQFDFEGARSKVAATQAKYASLKARLQEFQDKAAKIQVAENTIANLERQLKLEEEEYLYYQRNLEQMRLDRTIDLTSRNNISDIQEATLVRRDPKSVAKTLGGISAAGVAFGILLALLSDYVFNPSVKRPKELETTLRLPVFATIPDFGRKLRDKRKQKDKKAVQKNGSHPFANGDIAPWDEHDPMLPYYEALRDRLVMSYAGDLHKPKVVGITSCDRGAGVTRLATGLAASLSRDAERNILLVGLERNKVAVSGFAKGKPTNGIDAPPAESRDEKELVAQNLYSLATTGRNLAGASVVQSFSELLPKLKICDYDFIIFDLPPLTQTSGSLRLASQMERTILVVEAEETGKDKVKRAQTLLQDSPTRLATVLNKTHFYGPKSINSDL